MGTLLPPDAAYVLATGLASAVAPSGPESRTANLSRPHRARA